MLISFFNEGVWCIFVAKPLYFNVTLFNTAWFFFSKGVDDFVFAKTFTLQV